MSASQTQPIWCDEHGFTGNRLLDAVQPLFVYSSVAISAEEASHLAARLVAEGTVQGELKAAKLLNYNKGRKAIRTLLAELDGRFLLTLYDKKFALACKFFEYIFEPALSAKSSFFYQIRFHKFVANLLYAHFHAKAKPAEEIFEDFECAMRELSEEKLRALLLRGVPNVSQQGLQPIVDFGILNFDAIRAEIDGLRGHGAGKWVLDVTTSALFSHLGFWGDKFDQLEVYCDVSKPIAEEFPLDVLVGRTEKIYTNISGEEHLLTPNLSKPIELAKSKDHPGLQLADVIAGTAGRAFASRDGEMDSIRPALLEALGGDTVLPEIEEFLTGPSTRFHTLMLLELVRRSADGEPLLENLDQFLSGLK